MNDNPDWIFEEHQRDAVCEGKLCPKCLSEDVKEIGCAPDGMNMNYAYRCQSCEETWEGY